jgi:hypothetical protein
LVLLPQTSGPLNISEQERDGARRASHHPAASHLSSPCRWQTPIGSARAVPTGQVADTSRADRPLNGCAPNAEAGQNTPAEHQPTPPSVSTNQTDRVLRPVDSVPQLSESGHQCHDPRW